jgi:hypothetical protein
MKSETMHKFKWFWAWQDEKEEAWLSQMAQSGWHLQSPSWPGYYEFAAGEPRNDVYRLDYITNSKDYQNYLQLFKDAGWEHLGQMGGWQYFRKTAQGDERPEIYTDNASKATKYQRLLTILIVFLPVFMMFVIQPVPQDSRFYDLFNVAKVFWALLMVGYAIAMIKIMKRVQELRKK